MPKFHFHTASFLLISLISLLLTSCAEEVRTESELDNALKSDLNGVWEISHLHSNAFTQEFTKSSYRVRIIDDGENVEIKHCILNDSMFFTRSGDYLINAQGQQLKIFDATTLDSVDVPDVLEVRKTNLTYFGNAGRVTLSSQLMGDIDQSINVCAQSISHGSGSNYDVHISLSFPFENDLLEIDLHFLVAENGVLDDFDDFTLSSNSINKYYRRNLIGTLRGETDSKQLSKNRAKLSFSADMITEITNTNPIDRINGTIDVQF